MLFDIVHFGGNFRDCYKEAFSVAAAEDGTGATRVCRVPSHAEEKGYRFLYVICFANDEFWLHCLMFLGGAAISFDRNDSTIYWKEKS